MKSIRHLIWRIFGYPDSPPKNFKIKFSYHFPSDKVYLKRYLQMAFLWQQNYSLEDIAKEYNVTRERVRQCIWKAYIENEMFDGT